MAGNKLGNEGAFPSRMRTSSGTDLVRPGLTKREWFAGMALQGILAYKGGFSSSFVLPAEMAGKAAIEFADAVIARLSDYE